MTAGSPLDQLKALCDAADRDEGIVIYAGQVPYKTVEVGLIRAVIAALEAESETTVEWGVRDVRGYVRQMSEKEARYYAESYSDEYEAVVSRTTTAVTTHRTEWSTPDE